MKRLLLLLLVVVASARANVVSKQPPLPDFTKLLAAAETMIVWEGGPHPAHDRDNFAEAKQSPHHIIAGELFYLKALAISEQHQADLNRLVRAIDVLKPFSGEKFCGGFHADYAIEWKRGEDRLAAVLVCFSCRETLVVLPKEQVRADLTDQGYDSLRGILRKYRESRPPAATGKRKPLKPEVIPVPPPAIDLKPTPSSVRPP
jgi:hypothetical protein